jgi:hypothetical protein
MNLRKRIDMFHDVLVKSQMFLYEAQDAASVGSYSKAEKLIEEARKNVRENT